MKERPDEVAFKGLRSFGIRTVGDMLSKLEWEIGQLYNAEFSNNPTAASYIAVNASITAWHTVDWIWACSRSSQKEAWLAEAPLKGKLPLTRFGAFLKEKQRALLICQEVANSAKHLELKSFWDPDVSTDAPTHVTVYARAGTMAAGDAIARHSSIVMIRDGQSNLVARAVFGQASDFLHDFVHANNLTNLPA
ncbi:hypothetical protein ABRP29_06290 [Pseudomonas sp. WHRI 8822A]|uniref:hypothetical protein n=1 Tax=Pseudomonas sp. WHRI 8822A TaxID=3162568 RepID=UPI0032ED3CD9